MPDCFGPHTGSLLYSYMLVIASVASLSYFAIWVVMRRRRNGERA